MKHKKLVKSDIGVPLTEDQARLVDAIVKASKGKCTYQKTEFKPTDFELVEGERADISTITTDRLDNQLDVVLPKGINLDIFRAYPVVTFAHDYEALPVGICQWIKSSDNGLIAKTKYHKCPQGFTNWLPDACLSLIQEGGLRGKSIGFLATGVRDPTYEEIEQHPDWKEARAVVDESTLLEYAIAPVPVNPSALVLQVSKSFSPNILKTLGLRKNVAIVQRKINKVDVFKSLNWDAIMEEAIARIKGSV